MSDGSAIEWCDATWQPVVGCTRVSAGCDNCYAIGQVNRFKVRNGNEATVKIRPKGAARPGLDWSGSVKLHPEHLADPIVWGGKRGQLARRIFVCSQADLFHGAVPFEYVAATFGVMAVCPQHTFLVLTKRLERGREFFAWLASDHRAPLQRCTEEWWQRNNFPSPYPRVAGTWPLPNVHLGASVEDQATADERIPLLLELPAAVHWISLEPQLEAVALRLDEVIAGTTGHAQAIRTRASLLRWVVQGGESGPRARPFAPAWARSVRDECRAAGVAYFFKQYGGRHKNAAGRVLDGRTHDEVPR